MKKIDKFMGKYYFLSNFYVHTLEYPYRNSKEAIWLISPDKKLYKSVEHAYQAFKADNNVEYEYIMNLDTPGKAKRAGKFVTIRRNWEDIKFNLMLELLRAKFDYRDLAQLLIETGDAILIEGNYWHDNIWGDCTCDKCKNIEGKNMLGVLLMEVREEVKQYWDFENNKWKKFD